MPKTKSMRSFLKYSSIGILIAAACVPLITVAQGDPLVPCGNQGQNPCTFNDFFTLANNIVDFLFTYIVLPIMAVGILASGITILTAAGSSGQIEKGKKMLWNLGIGFFIAATAWVIVNTALEALVRDPNNCNFLTELIVNCDLSE